MESADRIYLDYNATTPLSEKVKQAITSALDVWGNPSSNSDYGKRARGIIENARAQVAGCIGADASEIIFMSGGTEANNSAIKSAASEFFAERSRWQEGNGDGMKLPHIISSSVEHDATSAMLDHLEEHDLAEVTRVDVDATTGSVKVDDVVAAVRPNTVLVTLMLANNETGVIFDLPSVCRKIRDLNQRRMAANLPSIRVHTDAAQAIGKISVNVSDLRVDFLTIVGHKFYGPRIGALYVRKLGQPDGCPFHPSVFGGGQERGRRPGTENTPMIAGLGAAAAEVDVIVQLPHLSSARNRLESLLKQEFGSENVVIHFEGSERLPNTTNVSFKGLRGDVTGGDILAGCSKVLASTGAACHSHLSGGSKILSKCGVHPDLVRTAVRLSVGRTTKSEDIDLAVADLKHSLRALWQGSE